MTNLPNGVSTSDLPGWSDMDLFLERQREKIEEELELLPEWLRHAILVDWVAHIPMNADFSAIVNRCNWLYEALRNDDGDQAVCAAVEQARSFAEQADRGPDEEEGI